MKSSLKYEFKIKFKEFFGKIKKFYLQFFDKKKNSFRILLIMEDETFLIIKNENIIKREESLSFIKKVKMIEFPLEKSIEKTIKEEINFFERLKNQFFQLKNFLISIFNFEKKNKKISIMMSSDKFGFKKLILILTKNGKLFCLNSLNGKIFWSKYFTKNLIDFQILKKNGKFLIYLIFKKEKIFVLNSIDGQFLFKIDLEISILKSFLIKNSLMIIEKNTKKLISIDNEIIDQKPFYFQEIKKNEIFGYSLRNKMNVRRFRLN